MTTLINRLETNDPTLTFLDLSRAAQFGGAENIPRFLQSLRNNRTVEIILLEGEVHDRRFRGSLRGNQLKELFHSFASMPLKSLKILGGNHPHGEIETSLLLPLVTPQMVELRCCNCMTLRSANAASSLGAAFRGHANLKYLLISHIKVYDDVVNGEAPRLDPLIQALGTVPTLEYVKLTGRIFLDHITCCTCDNPLISDESLVALSRLPNLKSLELSNLLLQRAGVVDTNILALLLSKQSLKTLVINNLAIGKLIMSDELFHEKVRPLLDSNYTIQTLKLSVISQEQQAVIDLYLRLNRAGRHVMKDSNSSTLEWIYLMDRVREDQSALFYILRERPDLCSAPNVVNQQE
jgi:hypothetical protein